jgi:hypothetical protein
MSLLKVDGRAIFSCDIEVKLEAGLTLARRAHCCCFLVFGTAGLVVLRGLKLRRRGLCCDRREFRRDMTWCGLMIRFKNYVPRSGTLIRGCGG